MSRLAIPALALILLATTAPAADELTWAGAPPTVYTLDLKLPPKLPTRPEVLRAKLVVDPSRFDEAGRVPRGAIESVSDLLWYHCLLLPGDKLPKRKGSPVTRDHQLTFPSKALVDAKERHVLSRKGKRLAAIVSQIRLSSQAQTLGWTQISLDVERVFDPASKRLELCSFRLVWVQADRQQFVWTGSLSPGEPIDLDPARFAARVEESIGRGRDALKKLLGKVRKGTGHPLGQTALACFALLRSGVPPAELEANFQFMAKQPFDHTYSVALYVMALEARSVKRSQVAPTDEVKSVTRFDRGDVNKRDLQEIQRATNWLLATRKQKEGWWSYSGHSDLGPTGHDGKSKATSGDRSNSQFAVLALHSAAASGVEISPEVWLEIVEEHRIAQEKKGDPGSLKGSEYSRHSVFYVPPVDDRKRKRNGGTKTRRPKNGDATATPPKRRGWAYGTRRAAGNGSAYGSMTSAGLSSLAVAREALAHAESLPPEIDQQARANLKDGLAWLAHRFDPARNPGRAGGWFFYYLYSVEKAMDLVGVEQLGRFPWWQQGAIELLSRQDTADGSWTKRLEDTSFALLFLNRATLPAKFEIEEVGRVMTGAEQAWDAVVVAKVGRVRGSEVVRSLKSVSRSELRERLKLAKSCVELARPDVQGRLLADLAPLTEHKTKSIKKFARKAARSLVRTEDPAELRELAEQFEDLVAWEQERDYAQIPTLVARLNAKAPALLRTEQLRVAGALRAVEAVDALLPLLEDKERDTRQANWRILSSLLGSGLEFDPKGSSRSRSEQVSGLYTWWEQNKAQTVRDAQIQRAVEDLARPARAEAAAKTLRGFGRDALRPLVDALRSDASRDKAHALLKELSGKKLGPDPQAWLDELGQ